MSDAGPSNQPIDLTSMAGSPPQAAPAAAPPTQVASLGDPGADYERAYAAILAGDYVLAEASFRSFIVAFPEDQRMPDARYWLGESLFARGEYRDAADEFLAGYKAYPQSGKAADTLLKLGLSLAGLGEREAACSTYAEVLKKYPNSSNALRQRVQTEQTVSRCA
jgi:tol-pal system protein YbgF